MYINISHNETGQKKTARGWHIYIYKSSEESANRNMYLPRLYIKSTAYFLAQKFFKRQLTTKRCE